MLRNVCASSSARKKPVSATPKEMEWAQMACHRCLVYLGDLGKSFCVLELELALKACEYREACNNVRLDWLWGKWNVFCRVQQGIRMSWQAWSPSSWPRDFTTRPCLSRQPLVRNITLSHHWLSQEEIYHILLIGVYYIYIYIYSIY